MGALEDTHGHEALEPPPRAVAWPLAAAGTATSAASAAAAAAINLTLEPREAPGPDLRELDRIFRVPAPMITLPSGIG